MKFKGKHKKLLMNILVVAIVIFTFVLSYIGMRIYLATDSPLIVIASGSMSPALEVGDMVIVQGVPPSSIKVGDIIVFDSPENVRTIHRVIEIQALPNGTLQFKTKGDANKIEDPYMTPEQNVHGRVLFKIPWLGWFVLIPMIPFTIAIILIIIILMWPEGGRKSKKRKLHFLILTITSTEKLRD